MLGLAAPHHAGPIRAFTLTFDRPDYDEGAIAREMAAHAGAEFHPIPVTQADLADHFADAVVAGRDAAAINAHGVAKYLLSRAVRDAGYKVVLTGEGSDEILAGYPHFRRDMLLHDAAGPGPGGGRGSSWRSCGRATRSRAACCCPTARRRRWTACGAALGFVPSWLEANATIAHKLRGLFSADFAAEVAGRDAYRELLDGLDVPGQLAGRAPVNQSLYLWSKVVLPNYVLTVLGDRMEMAHSVEGRVPFLDHHVVELAGDLPVSQKIRGTIEKYVLREAARPGADGDRLRPAQAPVPDAARRPWRPTGGCTSWCRTRCAARPWRRCRSSTGEGRGPAGWAAGDGRGQPDRVRRR